MTFFIFNYINIKNMKQLSEYITEAFSIRKLIQKFKRTAKEDTDKNAKTMEDARLAFYSMTKNSQGLVSAKEAIHIIKDIRMKFKDADYMFGFDNNDIRGFLQGFLDYGWMNYKNYLEQDKFGEHCCDAAFNRCMKQTNERDRNIGLACLGRFFYGWDFGKELDLRISSHWMVDWNSDDPFKIVEDTKKTTSNLNESYKWTDNSTQVMIDIINMITDVHNNTESSIAKHCPAINKFSNFMDDKEKALLDTLEDKFSNAA
jgi:hypothetical protein